MSGSASASRGGTPSTTTPIAGPWLSPQVVKRNKVPKVLPAIASANEGLSPAPTPALGGRGGARDSRKREGGGWHGPDHRNRAHTTEMSGASTAFIPTTG